MVLIPQCQRIHSGSSPAFGDMHNPGPPQSAIVVAAISAEAPCATSSVKAELKRGIWLEDFLLWVFSEK